MGQHVIKIEKCNCIKQADIVIEEGALNIKYGSNGTGKSTISKAIYAKSRNDQEEISRLKPFGESDLPVIGNIIFNKVRVFDESYVNSYLFKDKSFLENSYRVFLRSEECDKLSMQIALLLQELQGMFQNSDDIANLRKFIPQYFDAIKYKDGDITKRGGVGEFLKGNGGGFDKYAELKPYSAFYKDRDMGSVSKWAKWRNDGIQQMSGDDCPFCTHDLDPETIGKQNKTIAKVFKNSALSTASAVLEFIQKGVELGYIKEDAIKVLKSYIGNSSNEDDLYFELKQLALETEYLSTKIEKICLFKPMNVTQEQMDSIENNLLDMIIEERQISKFYDTDFINNLIGDIKAKIESLRKNTGQLKGLFSQHKSKMDKLIENRKDDINHFFALAGFPYEFILKSNGEEQASSYLVPTNFAENQKVEQPETHLSWGEKNAFSLVMFMFEAISDNADLIVLDDPITSFDKEKKFAVIRRLFDNQKISFRNKTVLMFTHDMQPVIDYVHSRFFNRFGLTTPVKTNYLQNENGMVYEYAISKDDLINTVELTKRMAKDEQLNLPVRVVNLRKHIELVHPDFLISPIYEVLSNIIHGRETPLDKDNVELSETVFNEGCKELNKYISVGYSDIIDNLKVDKLMTLINSPEPYSRVIAIRLLFERHDNLLAKLKKKYPATCKFVNETNHVENDYIFQLDPLKYFGIPEYYLKQLQDFIQNDSELTSRCNLI